MRDGHHEKQKDEPAEEQATGTHSAASTALLVVDTQVGVLAEAWNVQAVLHQTALAVQKAREFGWPVIWIQHQSEELPPGSAAWRWAPPLMPKQEELVLAKIHNSAFEATELMDRLKALGIQQIVLAGAQTNWCIRATAHASLERGFDLILLADAHTTSDLEPAPGLRIPAQHIIAELNVAMRWMDYPGRRCQCLKVAEAFSA